MNDLAIIHPEQLPANLSTIGKLSVAEMQSTLDYGAAAKSKATQLAYESDWRDFTSWCDLHETCALPADPGMVAAHLSSLADAGRKASTIGRRAAAICHYHRDAGVEHPLTGHAQVKKTMLGIRNTISAAPVQKAPATADVVSRMLAGCADTMIGCRDRALLALGCQIASNSDPLFASNIDPSSGMVWSLPTSCIGGTRARSAAPQALRGAKGAGGPCA